jgi:hypothetical protein
MNKQLTLFFAAVSMVFFAFGQKNLQPGFLVNKNHDTISGFIVYKEWRKNPEKVGFARTKELPVQKFGISEINGFSIAGKEIYRNYFVNISTNSEAVNEMTSANYETRSDSVFLKVLYDGERAKLFSYTDNVKSRLFISSAGEPIPVELRNTGFMLDGKLASAMEYKPVLVKLAKQYAPENSALVDKINATNFYRDDILAIVYAVNGQNERVLQPAEKRLKKPFYRLWAGLGVGINPVNVTGENRYAGITSKAGLSLCLQPALIYLPIQMLAGFSGELKLHIHQQKRMRILTNNTLPLKKTIT